MDSTLAPGVGTTRRNGMPMGSAVWRNAEKEAGLLLSWLEDWKLSLYDISGRPSFPTHAGRRQSI